MSNKPMNTDLEKRLAELCADLGDVRIAGGGRLDIMTVAREAARIGEEYGRAEADNEQLRTELAAARAEVERLLCGAGLSTKCVRKMRDEANELRALVAELYDKWREAHYHWALEFTSVPGRWQDWEPDGEENTELLTRVRAALEGK